MKKFVLSLMSVCLVVGLFLSSSSVKATDFEGQESKYIKLCSSSSLTSSQQKTCKEFNTYLKEKNEELQSESESLQDEAEEAEATIDELTEQIAELQEKISEAKEELEYVEDSIETLEADIEEKSNQLKERLYLMQTTINSNVFTTYIFGADSITDFISRVLNFQEITSYENDLVDELNESLAEVEKQKETLEILKESLEEDETKQASLKKEYQAKLEEQQQAIADAEDEVSSNEESIETIEENLAALKKAAEASRVASVSSATSNSSSSSSSSSSSNSSSSNSSSSSSSSNSSSSNSSSSNSSSSSSSSTTSSAELGLAIANKALSRCGCSYVYGACHSTSQISNASQSTFDCSGLVNWAHYQAGVNIGSQTTKTLASMGSSVSKSNLQAGDIILFSSNGSYSGVHHVGIYIGNNQMVHAPYTGTVVQVASLLYSYWQSQWYCARRLY